MRTIQSQNHKKTSKTSTRTSRSFIKIIAGKHRSRKLPVLDVDGLRPTSSRMKEAIFNCLQFDIANKICLDLFAGTGSLGIEALSRGAKYVDFVELDKDVAEVIKSNLRSLSLTDKSNVYHLNSEKFLNQQQNQQQNHQQDHYDVVFIDPPFSLNIHKKIIDLLLSSNFITKGSLLVVETAINTDINTDINTARKIIMKKKYKTKYSQMHIFSVL